jgi:hypothetical protein
LEDVGANKFVQETKEFEGRLQFIVMFGIDAKEATKLFSCGFVLGFNCKSIDLTSNKDKLSIDGATVDVATCIIKRSILYSAYGYYHVNHSMKGTVVREHFSKRRSSRPFAGYNHKRWFKKSLS